MVNKGMLRACSVYIFPFMYFMYLFYCLQIHYNSSGILRIIDFFHKTGLHTKDQTSETTVRNLHCLFPYIHYSLEF